MSTHDKQLKKKRIIQRLEAAANEKRMEESEASADAEALEEALAEYKETGILSEYAQDYLNEQH